MPLFELAPGIEINDNSINDVEHGNESDEQEADVDIVEDAHNIVSDDENDDNDNNENNDNEQDESNALQRHDEQNDFFDILNDNVILDDEDDDNNNDDQEKGNVVQGAI